MVRFNFLTLSVCFLLVHQTLSVGSGDELGEQQQTELTPQQTDETVESENESVNEFWKKHEIEVKCWKTFGNRLYQTLYQALSKPHGKETLTTIYKEFEESLKDENFLKLLQIISNEARDTLKDEVLYDLIKSIAKIVYTVLTKYKLLERDLVAIENFMTKNFTEDRQLAVILFLNAMMDTWDQPEVGMFFKALKDHAEKRKSTSQQRQLSRQELLEKSKAAQTGGSQGKNM